tara:strand:+ start:528 stop:746 length:219 start_codon:yes stop_codon:yes gene_type:complete
MRTKIDTLKSEIKTLQRTILEIFPKTPLVTNLHTDDNGYARLNMIAKIQDIIVIKQKEIEKYWLDEYSVQRD